MVQGAMSPKVSRHHDGGRGSNKQSRSDRHGERPSNLDFEVEEAFADHVQAQSTEIATTIRAIGRTIL
jgi:hypothetical protein